MQTIRRLYLYVVAFLSLEVVLWGIVGLLRSLVGGDPQAGSTVRLAQSLSMILVGLPVFLLHGWLVQRSAARDTAERSTWIRAITLHGVLLATLLPALFNLLALLIRSLLSFFGANPGQALVGGDQTGLDNLVAILLNLLAAGLFFLLLRADWRKLILGNAYVESRRLYRLLWLVISLAFIVFGLRHLLHFGFDLLVNGGQEQVDLANGLSLLLIGLPLWFFVSQRVQRSLTDPAEHRSFLRLFVIYALAFAGLSALLISSRLVLESLLRALVGAGPGGLELLEEVRYPFSNALALGAVWVYYERQLQTERKDEVPVAGHVTLHRLYRAVFAFFGLAATFFGLRMLLEIGLVSALAGSSGAGESSGASPATALAWLLVGLPVWFVIWRNMQVEVGYPGEAGNRARRSSGRKAYLYGILFLGIVGVMFSTGQLAFLLLQSALGDPPENLSQNALLSLEDVLLFALTLAYHGWVLRRDARLVESSLAKRSALYPVLLLIPGEGDFAERMVTALEHRLPGLPVAVHPVSSGAPDESLSAAKAVILPFELLARPPEALRLWLQSFQGERLVVPSPVENWHWVAGSRRSARDPVHLTARVVQDLVEGSWPPPE
jgi:hypothetical protein